MKLITFLESVETDRENAAYARRVADGIQEYLNLHEDSKVWGMKPVQREGGIVTMTMGVIPDMLRKLDWSDDDLAPLEDLHLLFIDEGNSELAGGYGKWQGHPIIILELLHPEKPMAYVNTRFSGKKKHFMHELTHHLDSVRTQDKAMGIAGRFKPEELKHNMAAYLSNPKEFNAYFIEVLEELDSVFFRVIPKIEQTNPEAAMTLAKHVLGNSFEEFVNKLTKQMFGAEFVMDEKYRKKFVRRLAKHYMDIVSTLRNKGLVEATSGGPDSTGWTHARTGQTFAEPAKIGVNHTPHFHHLRDRSEEMGVSPEMAQGAVDEFAGDAQLQAFDNGWMAWIYDADLYNLGAWLSVRTTLNGWIQNGAAVMKLIKKFAPDTISLDVIDPNSTAGINRELSFDADKTNPIEVNRWLRSLASVSEDQS